MILDAQVFTCCDTILKRSFIEDVGGKRAESGVHAVLYLQAYGTYSQHHQAFKQRLRQTGSRSFLTHNDGTQLTMIAHQDQLKVHKCQSLVLNLRLTVTINKTS